MGSESSRTNEGENMERQFHVQKIYILLLSIWVFLGLYLTSLHSYLLFHSFAEIFSMVVAFGIFVIAWNSRRFLDNNYLLFIGIAYLFVGAVDLIHTLAYKGMGVFQGYETNLPTQLWIAARYMESLSLLLAPFFFGRRLKAHSVFLGYVIATFLLLTSIFYWDIFPVCFVEGVGLTPFKKISEYIISVILLGSIVLLLKKQGEFERNVLQWVVWSIIATIASELAFTFYVHAYGFSNLIGHFLKILSFYFIYKAIIETGLTRPYDLLSQDLRQREEALARLASFPELNPNPIAEIDLTGNICYLNPAAQQLFPHLQKAGAKHVWLADFESLISKFKQEPKASGTREVKIGARWYQQSIHYAADDRIRIYGLDITDQKRMEEELRKSHDELERRVQKRTVELEKTNQELLVEIKDRKRAEGALAEQSRILEAFFVSTITPLVLLDRNFNFVRVNKAYGKACQRDISEFPGHNHFEFYPSDAKAIFEKVVQTKAPYHAIARPFAFPDHPEWGTTFWNWTLTPILNNTGEVEYLVFSLEDVTKRKEMQRRLEATNAILDLFVKKLVRKDYLDSVVELVRLWSDCRCVGIRVLNEKDYIPYESYWGFGEEFWKSENLLSTKMDQCACVRVVAANPDPQDLPVMTPAGSFRCENTLEFVGNLSEEEKGRFRGVCVQNGFKSVAIIPIRYREKVLGAIHLADEREERVPLSDVQFIESITPLIGEAIKRFHLEEKLRESENRLRTLSSQLLAVQEAERKRISREIHDSIGQSLTAIKFRVENTIEQMAKSGVENMAKPLETLIPIVQEAVEEARRIQMDLRPSILDDLGILATTRWFCREFQTTFPSIHIETQIDIQEDEVPHSLKTVLFRIMQEALNNVAKHGRATLIRLTLWKIDEKIELVVQDNGQGFDLTEVLAMDSSRRGLGLSSMRERAELSGGSFAIESTIGKGTTIKASWSLYLNDKVIKR